MLYRLRDEGGFLRDIPGAIAETFRPPEPGYLRMPSFPMTVL